MFCPQCGKRSGDGDAFCANCGTKLPSVAVPLKNGNETAVNTVDKSACSFRDGVIFTNLRALSDKLSARASLLRSLLEDYAEASRRHGVRYRLVDVSDYRICNPAAAGRHVELSPEDSWIEHSRVLSDWYAHGRVGSGDESCYLFIVGGEDIIPMPVVPNYCYAEGRNFRDKDIDTDIPYAYLLGEKTLPMLKNGKLFNYEQYFHVGRLPFSSDCTSDDLSDYLKRASQASGGISLDTYYGQSNLTWGDDSVAVCQPLKLGGLHSPAFEYDGAMAVYEDGREVPAAKDGLYFSPPFNAEKVFSRNADFYYFNLHGSDDPTMSGFMVDSGLAVIKPEYLVSIERPNVFVTEACYGARFFGYRRSQSMLLSAMAGQTLIYLGSSRVAFCNNRYPIDNSDRLANIYITRLLEGYTAGEALFLARQSFFEYDGGRLYDQQMTTIVEFNLFGDPSLRAYTEKRVSKSLTTNVITEAPVFTVSDSKCVYKSDGAVRKSILDEVRFAVDRNLALIRQTVDRELYDRFGVEPRCLSSVFHNGFSDGQEFYSFDYQDKSKGFEVMHTAIADKHGNIKTVISTK